ncbi:hypothetical protein ACHAXS_003618 [Conticribra weissflogii]
MRPSSLPSSPSILPTSSSRPPSERAHHGKMKCPQSFLDKPAPLPMLTKRAALTAVIVASATTPAAFAAAPATHTRARVTEGNSYAKYPIYPQYCSTPEEMEQRAIPPLKMHSSHDSSGGEGSNETDDTRKEGTRLVHVTALIRHGARTPWAGAPGYQCWDGYWQSEETGVWDCDLMTYMSPPSTGRNDANRRESYGQEESFETVMSPEKDSEGILEEEPDFLFEKRYDALKFASSAKQQQSSIYQVDPPYTTTGNELNGTCQLGQLLMRGYEQELSNGKHIRQAYFYDGNRTADEHAASDPRMRLWDLTVDRSGQTEVNNAAGDATMTNNSTSDTTATVSATVTIGDPTKKIYQEPNLRYRADDEQRTLMSGQILLRGLFGPELLDSMRNDDESTVIRLHTGDYSKDVLSINSGICPRLDELQQEAYGSEEFRKWNETSAEVAEVRRFVKEEMGLDMIPSSMLDCLMTTICTDRTLPDFVNDYDGSLGPKSWAIDLDQTNANDNKFMFERIANYAIKSHNFPYQYNDGAYAKLGMGPLWKEIVSNILPIVDSANYPSTTPPPKMALFSGHDTTLMPILATLGPEVWHAYEWAPYASMILIEIHEVIDSDRKSDFPSGYAFRLIYNGDVLTSKMDGCLEDSELCDAQILLDRVLPFAKFEDRDCTLTATTPEGGFEEKSKEMTTAAKNLVESPGGVLVVICIVLVSFVVGSLLTIFFMKRCFQEARHGKGRISLGELSMTVLEEYDEAYEENDAGGRSKPTVYGATAVTDPEHDIT